MLPTFWVGDRTTVHSAIPFFCFVFSFFPAEQRRVAVLSAGRRDFFLGLPLFCALIK